MSQPVLLKVYANITPATDALVRDLEEAASTAIAAEEGAQLVFHEGSIARISFEGIHFPVDEVLEAFGRHLEPTMSGKMDVLDLERWELTRHTFEGGRMRGQTRSLNSVLDYNGF